jgi:hypothetical protein
MGEQPLTPEEERERRHDSVRLALWLHGRSSMLTPEELEKSDRSLIDGKKDEIPGIHLKGRPFYGGPVQAPTTAELERFDKTIAPPKKRKDE